MHDIWVCRTPPRQRHPLASKPALDSHGERGEPRQTTLARSESRALYDAHGEAAARWGAIRTPGAAQPLPATTNRL